MRNQSLSLIVVGLLLGLVSGCHKPVNAVIILTGNSNAVYPYAEEGGTIQFIQEDVSDGFTVSFPDGVCEETSPISSHPLRKTQRQSATCHITAHEIKVDTFTVQQKSKKPGVPPPPPQPIETYIRQCPPGCKK